MTHQVIHFNHIPFEAVSDQVDRKMADGSQVMLLQHRVQKGFVSVKGETHVNEQFTYVLEGKIAGRNRRRNHYLKTWVVLLSFLPINRIH